MSTSNSKIDFSKFNELLTTKYKAKIITKEQFSDAVYGQNDEDTDYDIETLTEGIISNENVVIYAINNISVLNKYCKCLDPNMYYPSEEARLIPLPQFLPYILLAAELSDDKTEVISDYAVWTNLSARSIFEDLDNLKQWF